VVLVVLLDVLSPPGAALEGVFVLGVAQVGRALFKVNASVEERRFQGVLGAGLLAAGEAESDEILYGMAREVNQKVVK